MSMILKPYTIIPQELYVERDADRQVKHIINDMGRPGYVLVSRQMGKTNLLLNAKRNLQSKQDVFVYVDLSNSFKDARSCFENIIDLAVETNLDKFSEIYSVIRERRSEIRDTPAHKQHNNELRILLKALDGGKLVIILDEIDALTKTDYSDQIFAQIRSSYFSGRVNYPEFYNLTYLLSGVVEPTEIIKDSKISPFNIGQKIFLNDFSRGEFDNFLSKSNLNLHDDTVDRIFYWTNGNPRITWDVCAEIETVIKLRPITNDSIDEIVNRTYLTTYDKPPIDNIRELTKKDKEIRRSLIDIENNRTNGLSDRIKSKLYLSGIINYENSEIKIKNQIIKLSLNGDWLRSLEEEEKGLFKIATELFEEGKYLECLSIYERYLVECEEGLVDLSLVYYYMGYAAYRISNFEKSISYLDKASFNEEDEPKLFYRVLSLKGLVYYYTNDIDKSLGSFKVVIESNRNDEDYVRALLNFGSISLKSENEIYKLESVKIFQKIISDSELSNGKLKDSFVNELKAIAFYNLAQSQLSDGLIAEAIANYYKAVEFARDNTKPKIILSLLKVRNNQVEERLLFEKLCNLIIEGKIKPEEQDPEKPLDFNLDDFRNILIIAFTGYREDLFTKLEPFLYFLSQNTLGVHLYELAMFSINNRDSLTGVKLLKIMYDKFGEYEFEERIIYRILKYLALFTKIIEDSRFAFEYALMFKRKRFDSIDDVDMEIFANLGFYLIDNNKLTEGLSYLGTIKELRDEVPESVYVNFIVIYHIEFVIYRLQKDRQMALDKANEILQFIEEINLSKQYSNLLGDTGLEHIRQGAKLFIEQYVGRNEPVRVGKVFGRNEIVKVRYKDGSVVETKYKKVSEDIRQGSCIILD